MKRSASRSSTHAQTKNIRTRGNNAKTFNVAHSYFSWLTTSSLDVDWSCISDLQRNRTGDEGVPRKAADCNSAMQQVPMPFFVGHEVYVVESERNYGSARNAAWLVYVRRNFQFAKLHNGVNGTNAKSLGEDID